MHFMICTELMPQAQLHLRRWTVPSGFNVFSQDVSFSSGGSWELEVNSEKPESVVRVERESGSASAAAEARAAVACATSEGPLPLRVSRSAASPAPLARPGCSSGVKPSGTLPDVGVRSPRHWLTSGDVRPDWKGGWNTFTEYLGTARAG